MSDITPPPELPLLPPKNGDLLDRIEHFEHWWREPLAGLVAVAIACVDIWEFGGNEGFSNSLDEILVLTGVALIAGVKNLFGGAKLNGNGTPPKPDH